MITMKLYLILFVISLLSVWISNASPIQFEDWEDSDREFQTYFEEGKKHFKPDSVKDEKHRDDQEDDGPFLFSREKPFGGGYLFSYGHEEFDSDHEGEGTTDADSDENLEDDVSSYFQEEPHDRRRPNRNCRRYHGYGRRNWRDYGRRVLRMPCNEPESDFADD